MNGNRYVLDTNVIVALLRSNSQLVQLLQRANWVGFSVISQIELLAFSGLTQSDCHYIMDTFPIVKRKDEKAHGHYRTKDTILQTYDAMATAITSGQP